jgi:hypothetical protein
MTDFDDRLQKANRRGEHRQEAKTKAALHQKMTEEQLKSLHGKYRLQLSEHIEECMKKLPDHFPGFQYETVYGEKGWGAACSRNDFGGRNRKQRDNLYSRLMMAIRPHARLSVLELVAKATVRNKEVFNRTYFEELEETEPERFLERIDYWVIEFAELYAAMK